MRQNSKFNSSQLFNSVFFCANSNLCTLSVYLKAKTFHFRVLFLITKFTIRIHRKTEKCCQWRRLCVCGGGGRCDGKGDCLNKYLEEHFATFWWNVYTFFSFWNGVWTCRLVIQAFTAEGEEITFTFLFAWKEGWICSNGMYYMVNLYRIYKSEKKYNDTFIFLIIFLAI